MDFDAVLIAPRQEKMVKDGFWLNKTIIQSLREAVQSHADKTALVSFKTEQNSQREFSYQQIWQLTNTIALGLKNLGVQKSDVVSCQLPNWWEFTLLYLACSRIGAVLNPLMPIFRERELEFMLRHGESKVFVVPQSFRNFNHADLADQLKEKVDTLEHVIVVGSADERDFEQVLLKHGLEHNADAIAALDADTHPSNSLQPDDVTQLIFTSGTTGEPKGVMHTSNTLFANIVPYAAQLNLGENDVVLMASLMWFR